MKNTYILYTLGSRGSRPVSGKEFDEFGGATTCYIVKTGTHALVLDCGTGLYNAKEILKDCDVIDVAFSHMHYDHILGLLDWSVFPKDCKLTFYSAFSNWFGTDSISQFIRPPYWPIAPGQFEMMDVSQDGTSTLLQDDIVIKFYPSKHPNEACLIKVELENYVMTVMFDCEFTTDEFRAQLEGSDLLIYDGMLDDSEYFNCVGWGHSTWSEGCRIARDNSVQDLIITHHHPAHTDDMLRAYEEEAKQIFPQTIFAREGDVKLLDKE